MNGSMHVLSSKLWKWPWNGILLGGITWLLVSLFRHNPLFVEVVYTQGLYSLFRWIWDYTLGWLPFAWVYVLVPVLGCWLLRAIRRKILFPKPWKLRIRRMFLGIGASVGMLITIFYFSWGFNYLRVPIEDQLGMVSDSLSRDELEEEFFWATNRLLQADSALGPRAQALTEQELPSDLEGHMREVLSTWLRAEGMVAPGRPRGRKLGPPGMLMQLGATGIYLPFVAEGHIDAALPPASRPFTLAHELGHAYGFGDEGTCNFLGWIACKGSDLPAVKYSGALAYWREVANRLSWLDRACVLEQMALLPTGIQGDLAAIKATRERYPGFFPRLSHELYDQYLQAQGIEEGVLNYARVIQLVRSWRDKSTLSHTNNLRMP